MKPFSRIYAWLSREPLAVSALLIFALLYLWDLLTLAEFTPLPNAVGPQAIETIGEVWCVFALPALWLAANRRAGPLAVFVAALVPPIVAHLALFAFGSVISTESELAQNAQIVQFVLGATAVVSTIAACMLLLLRAAKANHGSGKNAA